MRVVGAPAHYAVFAPRSVWDMRKVVVQNFLCRRKDRGWQRLRNMNIICGLKSISNVGILGNGPNGLGGSDGVGWSYRRPHGVIENELPCPIKGGRLDPLGGSMINLRT